MDYEPIETALKAAIVTAFAPDLSLTRVASGDIDTLFTALQTESAKYGCILDIEEGRLLTDLPFNGRIWLWRIVGSILVRFEGNSLAIEQDARQVIGKLAHLFDHDPRLGGTTQLAKITAIRRPEPSTINDIPFYWITFLVDALDKY